MGIECLVLYIVVPIILNVTLLILSFKSSLSILRYKKVTEMFSYIIISGLILL